MAGVSAESIRYYEKIY
nr:hypothetical protein [Aerococcus sp.]